MVKASLPSSVCTFPAVSPTHRASGTIQMQTTFTLASVTWVFLQRCIPRYKIPRPDINSGCLQDLTPSMAETEFIILPDPLKCAPPPSFLSVNATIIHQLCKPETWESPLPPYFIHLQDVTHASLPLSLRFPHHLFCLASTSSPSNPVTISGSQWLL